MQDFRDSFECFAAYDQLLVASQGQKLFIYKNDQKLLEVNLGFHIVNLFIYQKEQTQTVVT